MTDNTTYFTFKTKEEVLNLIDPKANKDAIVTTIKSITKVSAPIIPHLGFIPELRIQAPDCNLYSGYNCVRSIGWQLQELFELVVGRNDCALNDDREDIKWFTGKEVDVIVIDDYPIYKVVAIGDANADKWINIGTWVSDVVAKHTK